MKRFILLCLVFSVFALSLASCTPTDPEEVGSRLPSSEDDWFHDLDFGGKTIVVRYNEGDDSVYTKGPDEKGSDTVLDRCYDRNLSVTATLGLKVESRVGENTTTYLNEIALMPSGCPDLVFGKNRYTFSATMQGFLRDARVAPAGEENYFNFESDVWYTDFMAGLTIDRERIFALAGDYFIDVLREAECLYLNTKYYEEKIPDSLQDFYNMVERGRFTGDEMRYMIELAYEDNIHQGYVDMEDNLGLLCRRGTYFYPWMYGSNASLLEETANGWMFRDNPIEYTNLVDEIMKVYNAIGSYQATTAPGQEATEREEFLDLFKSGRVLFVNGFTIGDLEHTKMLNMDRKVAVVYPILSRSQGYYNTQIDFNAEVGFLPVQAKQNHAEISAYVQLLNEQSTDIVDQYFEESLKFKYSTEAVGAGRMIDIIHDTVSSGFEREVINAAQNKSGLLNTEFPFPADMVSSCIRTGQNDFARQWAAVRDAYQDNLQKIKEDYAALNR